MNDELWTIEDVEEAFASNKEDLVAFADALCGTDSRKGEGYAIHAYCLWRENGVSDKNLERYIFRALYLDPTQPLALYLDECVARRENYKQ